jgi:phosphate transport system substrate-binding protein
MVSRIAIVILALSALAACGGGHGDRASGGDGGGGTLTIKGSDTMVILAQRWAEEFMREHPGATIQVSGGGTGTGIAALIHGTTDIADASRPIGAREIREIRARRGRPPHEARVALDAIAVYVHEGNPVRSLTLAQLSAIYRGAIRDWSEVGGPRRPIVLYSRENNSGTYAYFKAHVLGDLDFAPETQTLPGTAAVINAVSQDPAGIGYGGIGYAARMKTLAIAAEGRAPVRPTIDAATSGRYPLARDLCVYTVGEPRGLTRRFVEWVRSPAGQRLVEAAGDYPLPRGGAAAELR